MSATPDSFQVSPQQEEVWAAEPGGPTARIQALLAVDGQVDRVAIETALRLAVRRHESMRTTFVRRPGLTLPLQVVNELLEPRIETLDLTAAGPKEQAERTASALQSELEAPFDFEHGPLVRAKVVIKSRNALELIVTVSALCADEASMSLLLGEVAGHLAAIDLVEDPLQYADFSAWQLELRDSDGDEARAARAFWDELGDVCSPVLPFTRARESAGTLEEITIGIDEALAEALSDRAQRCGAPASAFGQAGWHAVLGRFSGGQSSVVAFVPAARRHRDLESALGAFARPVPIEARLDGTRSCGELLAEVTEARADALVRQDYAPASATGAVEIGFIEYHGQLAQPEGMRLAVQRMLRAGPEFGLFLMCRTLGHQHACLGLQHEPFTHLAGAVHDGFAPRHLAHRADGGDRVADPDRRLEHDGGGNEDRAFARQLRAHHRRDEPHGERAMRDPAAEYGLAGKVLVEMDRVHVPGGFAEQLDVPFANGIVRCGRHAGFELVKINRRHRLTI